MKKEYRISELTENLKRDFPEETAFDRPEFAEELAGLAGEKVNLAVRILTGTGSWFASFFVLGFLFLLLDLGDFEKSWLFLGCLMSAGCLIISHFVKLNEFTESFLTAVSFAGQVLAAFGAYFIFEGSIPFFLTIILIQIALFIFSSGYLQRFISVIVFNLFAAGLFWELKIPAYGITGLTVLNAAWLTFFVNEEIRFLSKMREYIKMYVPFTEAVAFSLLLLQFVFAEKLFSRELISPFAGLVSAWILAAGAAYTLFRSLIINDFGIKKASFAAGGLFLILLPFGMAPGIAASVLVLSVGYANGRKILIAAGILALSAYISWFYYSLNFTLLEKSGLLIFSGLALLLFRFLSLRFVFGKK